MSSQTKRSVCEQVYKLIDELGAPSRMSRHEYIQFLEELLVNFHARLDAANDESRNET
jgi:hypothetical protein